MSTKYERLIHFSDLGAILFNAIGPNRKLIVRHIPISGEHLQPIRGHDVSPAALVPAGGCLMASPLSSVAREALPGNWGCDGEKFWKSAGGRGWAMHFSPIVSGMGACARGR